MVEKKSLDAVLALVGRNATGRMIGRGLPGGWIQLQQSLTVRASHQGPRGILKNRENFSFDSDTWRYRILALGSINSVEASRRSNPEYLVSIFIDGDYEG